MNAEDLSPYDGEWVAVRDGQVIAHAEDERALRADPNVKPDDDLYPIGPPTMGYMVSA